MTGRDDVDRKAICEKLITIFDGSVLDCEIELDKLEAIARVLGEKDAPTHAHSYRVLTYTAEIANELGIGGDDLGTVCHAAALHDVGKIGVPDEILAKPDRLTEEEVEIMRRHPEMAAQMLEHLLYPKDCVQLVYHHHEWFNGEGYPDQRLGEGIPLGARVIAVADAFDAMTSDRPYRKAVSAREAEWELLDCAGSQFDPDVVRALCAAKKKGRLRSA